MKATAKAPANIAFIKYWGRKDDKLRLPANNSIAMNLSNVYTVTTVQFSKEYKRDEIEVVGSKRFGEKEKERIIEHLDRIRELSGIGLFARVKTKNNFPTGVGIASSASGFAALSLAGCRAAGIDLSEKQLSILARKGSGSACRSIPDGFVEWRAGTNDRNSYAYSLYPPHWWKITDVVAVIGEAPKEVSSSEGHVRAESSPFYKARISKMDAKIRALKIALGAKDFKGFGEVIEEEAINMHAVMMTSAPPLFYWLPETMEIILLTAEWRDRGLEVYFTIDAGPNVHLICLPKDAPEVVRRLREIGVRKTIVNDPAPGARIVTEHLF